MKYDKVYQKLKEKYTKEEIADAMIISADLTKEEKGKTDEEFKKLRLQRLKGITKEEQTLSDVIRLRFQIENYIKSEVFSFKKTFGHFLAEYIRVLNKTKRDFANDLSIHYTKLSRILNDKEEPNIELSYRLEEHSGQLISATLWWKLMIKKQEFIIENNTDIRKIEAQKVKNALVA